MKPIKTTTLAVALLLLIAMPALAIDDLADLADDATGAAPAGVGAETDTGSDTLAGLSASPTLGPDRSVNTITFGGYLKTLAYWNEERYSDDLWTRYQTLPSRPAEQELSGYNNIGSRLQLKVEGFLGRRARLFSAINVNYNLATSLHQTAPGYDDPANQNAEMRLVEGYVEIFQGRRSWKVGSQIVTWGYMEGIEVPTDRVNARDHSYKSTEYEDSKLPSTGILLTQGFGPGRFDLMYFPVPRANVSLEFLDYFYPGADEKPQFKPNEGKWAARLAGNLGNLDIALSYIEGMDPVADLSATIDPATMTPVFGRAYNRVRSPGLDLQYNLGSWLAKLSWAAYQTEDRERNSPLIKNDWQKWAAGTEFTAFDTTVNLYLGQTQVEDFPDDPVSNQTNFLLGQIAERIDFVSGHLNADFLPGNALNLILMGANYWDQDGETLQTNLRANLRYKMADGLELLFGPSMMEMMDNRFTDAQLEVKYSF
jgi:hypothetical protein